MCRIDALEDVELALPDVPSGVERGQRGPELLRPHLVRCAILSFDAKSYDALADAPIEISNFKEFSVPGVPVDIRAVVHGDEWSQKKIEADLQPNLQLRTQIDGWSAHSTITSSYCTSVRERVAEGWNTRIRRRLGFPRMIISAGVAAHEFFHLWNVKRIRPATLEPVDFTKEQYTRALWFAEGVTSTYGAYTLVRTGLWSKERFYADLGDQISDLESRPANHWQSAEQSSLDAWLEKYPLYNGPEDSVSYYTKGAGPGRLAGYSDSRPHRQ